MSRHAHISHDKCLNCGEHLSGRYCHKCGQDSQEHLDSVLHLIRHFFEDITHYDGKLWKTAQPLLMRPGLLTQEYLKGRRASYLNPVRMFIFLNFIFFFLLLSLPSGHSNTKMYSLGQIAGDKALQDSILTEDHEIDSLRKNVKIGNVASLQFSGTTPQTREQYDSVQASLPPAKRDGRVTKAINEKGLDFLQSIKRDPDYVKEKINEIFFHNSAKLTFLFLIVCTLLLALLYYRRHIFMIDHALFSIHLSCTFLFLSVVMLLLSYLPFGGYINFAIFLYGNYYFYRALRNVWFVR